MEFNRKVNDLYRSTPYCFGLYTRRWMDARFRLLDAQNAKVFENPFLKSAKLHLRPTGVNTHSPQGLTKP